MSAADPGEQLFERRLVEQLELLVHVHRSALFVGEEAGDEGACLCGFSGPRLARQTAKTFVQLREPGGFAAEESLQRPGAAEQTKEPAHVLARGRSACCFLRQAKAGEPGDAAIEADAEGGRRIAARGPGPPARGAMLGWAPAFMRLNQARFFFSKH